jgi:hypothetical protein
LATASSAFLVLSPQLPIRKGKINKIGDKEYFISRFVWLINAKVNKNVLEIKQYTKNQ